MPKRVKRTTKRKTRRVKRSGFAKILRAISRPHYFKRSFSLTTANVNTIANGGAGSAISNTSDSWSFNTGTGVNISYFSMSTFFTLDMLPDYADFTQLFDQYKILKVKFKLTPYSTFGPMQSGVGTANNQSLGVMQHQYVDYDDATALAASSTGINSMRQFLSYRSRNLLGRPTKRSFRPRMALAAYASGAFTSYANQKSMWIDANSPTVQHYGLKTIWEVFQPDFSVPVFIWFKLECTMYLACKQPR